ncbi:hypothetical protein EMIT0P253_10357 [Pseudomonas sp. IT-P253]
MDLQSIHNTSNFNRLTSLAFRKLLIFKGLHPAAFNELDLSCGTVFFDVVSSPNEDFLSDLFNPPGSIADFCNGQNSANSGQS